MTGIPSPLVGTFAQNTSAATTLNVPYPASLTSSHIMVLGVADNSVTPATLPAGWTQVARFSGTGSTVAPGLLVAIKQATGSESGNLAVTTPSVKSSGQIVAFTGVNLTTPQDVTATTKDETTSQATVGIPTLTTTRTGCALVYISTHNSGSDTSTPPSAPAAFTETGDNPGAGGWAFGMGYLIWGSSGATGTVTVTYNASAKGLGVLVALRALDQAIAGDTTVTKGTPVGHATLVASHAADAAETATATLAGDWSLNRGADAQETITAGLSGDLAASHLEIANLGVTATLGGAFAADKAIAGDLTVTKGSPVGHATLRADHMADATLTATATLTAADVAAHAAAAAETVTATLTGDLDVLAGGNFKVYIGGAWTSKPLKVWNGSAWVHKPAKTWNGSAWVTH